MPRFTARAVALPALATVVTAAAVVGLLAAQRSLAPTPTVTDQTDGPTAIRLRWPDGHAWRYRLELSGHKSLKVEPSPVQGTLDLATGLVLRSYGQSAGVTTLGLRFVDVERHALVVLGQSVMPDADAARAVFDGREALLEVAPDGVIRQIRFAPEDPTLFKHLAQLVAGEIQLVVKPGHTTWEAREPTQHGEALTDYEVTTVDRAGMDLGRYRFDYARLDGAPSDVPVEVEARYAARVAAAGHVVRLSGEERIKAGEVVAIEGRIALELQSSGPAADDRRAPIAARSEARALDQWPVSPEARAAMLERRAGDLTRSRIMADLRAFGPGGEMPHHSRWAWQAVGRLLLDPRAASDLSQLIVNAPEIGHKGRALAMDLLVSAGHPEAQAALRHAVDRVERDERFPLLVQRLGFVKRPEPATVEAVATVYRRSSGVERRSAATTLGAAAGHLYREGHPDEALAHLRRLEGDLRRADGPESRRALILALGNAGLDESVSTLVSHAGDADPAIRRAVARALRKTPGLVAEEALGKLMVDADARVSQAAVRALGRHPLNADHLTGLAEAVQAGALGPATHSALVDLLVAHPALDVDARRQLARAVAARTADGRLRARLTRL